jgi:hypothetical protein
MRKLFALAVLCAASAFAQMDTFTVSYSATLSAAQTAVSIQLPTSGNHQAEIAEVTVGCSAACPVRLEINGSAATANGSTINSVSPQALNPESTPSALQTTPNFNAFSGSGIPSGTAITPTWTIPAGAILPFGGGRVITGAGGAKNYIVRVPTNYTGDIQIFISVRSRR